MALKQYAVLPMGSLISTERVNSKNLSIAKIRE